MLGFVMRLEKFIFVQKPQCKIFHKNSVGSNLKLYTILYVIKKEKKWVSIFIKFEKPHFGPRLVHMIQKTLKPDFFLKKII